LGPKKVSAQPVLIYSPPTVASVPRHLPLIYDPNFTPEELQSYRGLFYSYTTETWTQGITPILMRFLWGEYGLTFSNDALMSAALAVRLPLHSMSKEERDSKIRKSIVKAICTQRLSTEHLFAIFFAILRPPTLEDMWIHMSGFVTVLQHLMDHCTLSASTSNKPLVSVILTMIVDLQRRAQCLHRSLSPGFAYKLICDLKYLSEQLQPPSQGFSLLIESASLSRIFPNGQKTTFLSGLMFALEDIWTHMFVFVYRSSRDEQFQHPIPYGELIKAEEKLRVLENSALVREIFTRVRTLLWSNLIR
jgi:hypothetical protein